MSAWGEIVVGLVIVVGLLGIVIPILPGVILIFAAIAVWAFLTGSATAWSVFAISTVLLVISGVIKYTWPGRKLKEAGVPNRSLYLGAILGIIGFFVIPVVGLFVGFIAACVCFRTPARPGTTPGLAVHLARGEGCRPVHPGGTARRPAGSWRLAGERSYGLTLEAAAELLVRGAAIRCCSPPGEAAEQSRSTRQYWQADLALAPLLGVSADMR